MTFHRAAARVGAVAACAALIALFVAACGDLRTNAAGDRDENGGDDDQQERTYPMMKVEIAGETFNMKLALNFNDRHRGLGGMTKEQIGDGMLFAFPQAEMQSFYMKDCLVDIDIAFVSPAGRVTAIHQMKAEPPETRSNPVKRYSSQYPALIALEFNAGTLEKLGLKPGDKLDLPLEALKQRAR